MLLVFMLHFFKADPCCYFNPLNAELHPICHLLALLGGATIVVVSRLRVKKETDVRSALFWDITLSITGNSLPTFREHKSIPYSRWTLLVIPKRREVITSNTLRNIPESRAHLLRGESLKSIRMWTILK